jgi:hypothetical protein
VWLLEDGKPKAVKVTVGSADGSHTEVTSAELRDGASVLVDVEERK